jgi:DNA-directed RNA polymerase specialized sigma subunit
MKDGLNSSNYVSVELFERTLPAFKAGLEAKDRLDHEYSDLDRLERIRLRQLVRQGEAAYDEVCTSCSWIIRRVVKTEMGKPRSFHVILDAEDLEQAGLEAVWKMMRTADVEKMRRSAVNYLMQWISTNVSRAALKEEAEFGMSSSKINMMKKIAAVRARLAKKIGHSPSNEEVYDFLQSGHADMKTVYGRSDNHNQSKANKLITMDMIEEQSSLNAGTPMKYAVTDPSSIDASIDTDQLGDDYQEILEEPTKAFWQGWMQRVHIQEQQWDRLAALTGVYDVDATLKVKKSPRLVKEFYLLIGSRLGNIDHYAREWSDLHGPGRWDVFKDAPLKDDVQLDTVDESGRPVFTMLKISGGSNQ